MMRQSANPNEYQARTYLLIDDLHIERQEGVEPVLCDPVKAPDPVLKPEKPWEGSSVNLNSGFLYDEEEEAFKLWYSAHDPDAYPELRSPHRAAYAVSADCRDWKRPNLGLTEWGGNTDNNLTRIPPIGGGTLLGGIIKDSREADPAKRYKAMDVSRRLKRAEEPDIWFRGKRLDDGTTTCGLLLGYSADGFDWHVQDDWLMSVAEVTDASFLQGWDERLSKWVIWARARAELQDTGKYRTYGVILTDDLEKMSYPVATLIPDANDPPGMQFDHFRSFPVSEGYVGLVTTMHTDPVDAFRMEVQLCYSRDLLVWDRAYRKPCLPGGESGAWDERYIIAATPVLLGDTIYILYAGHNLGNAEHLRVGGETRTFKNGDRLPDGRTATGAIGLATLKKDRWVSREPVRKFGVLQTRPLYCARGALEVNADASKGSLRAELVDHLGRPVEGFAREDCDPFAGDSLAHTVTWSGNADFSEIIGDSYHYPQVARLLAVRFYLEQARLFSFSF
jgi:hypothetical protein